MFQNWPLLRLFWVFGLKANVSRKVCFWVGNLPFRPKTSVFGRKRAFSICDAFVLKLAWKRNVSFTQPNILLLVSKCMFFAEKTYKKKQSLAYIALKDDQRGPLKNTRICEYQGINLDKSYIPIISQRNSNYFGWLNSLCVPIDSPVSNHKLPSVIWYRWPIETE